MKFLIPHSSNLSIAWVMLLCAGAAGAGVAVAPNVSVLPTLDVNLDAPTRVASDALGNTYVVDSARGRVVTYDAFNRYVGEKGGFHEPLGIAVDHAGNLYLGEAGTGSVTVYDSQWNRLSELGIGEGEFGLPGFVALDEGTTPMTVYVSDGAANALKAYQEGALVRTMGGPGSSAAKCDFPAGVWVDAAGVVFLVDQRYNRALVYDRDGAFLRGFNLTFATASGLDGRYQGIVGDSQGRLYVADTFQGRVSVFESHGTPLATIGGYGIGAGQLRSPAGLALDVQGRLKVASPNNGRVEVFGLDCFTQFSAQPAIQTAAAGSTVTFHAQPGCLGPFTYQWRKGTNNLIDGGIISGATNATLTLAGISSSDGGGYSVVIVGPEGAVSSPELQLAVIVPPSLVSSPVSAFAALGSTVVFGAEATGADLVWRWFFNGNALNSANTNILMLTNVQFSAAGQYRAVATNLAGSVSTAPATLTVLAAPYVVTPPTNQSVAERGTATFTVQGAGGSPIGYQWFFGASPLAGRTNVSLVLTNVRPLQSGQYFARVSNPVGFTNSPSAMLVVQPDTVAPVAQSASGGAPTSRTILVSFSEPVDTASAQQLTNYQLLAPDGLTVVSAAVTNGSVVQLTLSNSRNPDNSYQLRIQNVRDIADTPNVMQPNPTVLTVRVDDPFETVAWWPLDEAAGLITRDISGKGRNGTLENAVWTAGRFGAGLSFNGSSSDVVIPALNLYTNTVTITAWVRRTGSQAASAGIVFYRSGSSTAGLDFGTANELRYHWNDVSSSYNFNSGLVVPDGVWTFTALVVEPTRATFYLNRGAGLLSAVNTTAHAIEEFNGSGYLGYDPYNASRRFNGALDEVRVFNHALTAAQIQTLYTARVTPALVGMLSPANASTIPDRNPLLLATVTSFGNVIDKVDFLSGNTLLGTTRTSPYSMVWSNLLSGSYSVQARVWFGSAQYSSVSPVANFTISSPIQAALSMTDGTMTLQWAGGFAPYQVQCTTNLAIPDWEDVGPLTDETSMVLLPATGSSFYRIVGN